MIPRRRAVSRGRAALIWTIGLFAAGQWALGAWLHRAHPEMCDPTWAFRLARLRERLAEAPGRPLLVTLGSSRTANGISPSAFADWEPRNGPRPVVFNFATLGAGPIRELLTFRRLLAHGIRPDWLVVEVWPAFWLDKGHYEEHMPILQFDAQFSDISVLRRVYGCGWETFAKVVETNLVPIAHYRTELFSECAPLLVSEPTRREVSWSRVHWSTLDPWGWLPVGWPRASAEEFARQVVQAHDLTQPRLEELRVTDNADWTIRTLLGECRQHRIQVALLYMPEHSALRSWYPPQALSLLQDYLTRLGREFAVPIIDTRHWLDDDCFQDVLHLHPDGARAFSARFGREVLRPLLEGAPLPAHAALHLDGDRDSSGSASPAESALGPLGP
jgi:hypothetical protein